MAKNKNNQAIWNTRIKKDVLITISKSRQLYRYRQKTL